MCGGREDERKSLTQKTGENPHMIPSCNRKEKDVSKKTPQSIPRHGQDGKKIGKERMEKILSLPRTPNAERGFARD